MTIQEREKFLAIAVPLVLLAAFLVFAGYGWQQEHDARLQAETQTGRQQQQIDGLKQQQSAARQALAGKLAFLEKERQRPATAALLASGASALIPSLPEPLRVVAAAKDPALPNAPAAETVVIPEADFKAVRDAQIGCEENAARLAACQAIGGESGRQMQLVEAQRDEWKAAAKGGSLWHRALGAAKWFAIGAGAGAAGYAVAHRR